MAKRANTYRLTLEQLTLASGLTGTEPPWQLEVSTHDELFGIIAQLRAHNPFSDPQQATEFALGLKLLSEVLLKNRSHPLVEDFWPAFQVFMKKLKSRPAQLIR